MKLLITAAVAICISVAMASAQSLSITSPVSGTVFHPGDAISVAVQANGNFGQIMTWSENPLVDGQPATTAPYVLSVTVPLTAQPGLYSVSVVGLDSAGQNVVIGPPITIDVERPDTPTQIITEPTAINLYPGDVTTIRVLGTFSDGSTLDLTTSSATTLTSANSNIITVDSNGLLTAVAPGTTSISINGSYTVPVTVETPFSISPAQATVTASHSTALTVIGNGTAYLPISWSINPAVGNIDSNGVYTAPDNVAAATTITVTATNAADVPLTASATITVSPIQQISVSPSWSVLYGAETQQFVADTSNIGSAGISWSIAPSGIGSISQTGIFTAPAAISTPTSVTVTATSVASSAIYGSATVWLLSAAIRAHRS